MASRKYPCVFALSLLLLTGVQLMGNASEIADGVICSQDLFNTSMRDGVACYRIPALATAPNGDLVAAIDERVESCDDLRSNKDINIVVRRSGDNGVTWGQIETVVNFPFGVSASDPSMIVDSKTGDIFLFYNYMDLNAAKGVYRLHVVKSGDNGATWGKPEDITDQITKPKWHKDFQFITSGNGIQTTSGTLLHTLVNLNHGLHVFGSQDHGKTWFRVDTALKPGDESRVVELADGGWMVNSRVNRKEMRYVHTSADNGNTWTTRPDPALIDPACNAGLIRYTSKADGFERNRLLFSNAKDPKNRANMTVRVSYDEGITWTDGKTIYAGSSAYSVLTVLKNGDVGLLFEKDDYKKNVFVRFSLEWLTDGKDKYELPKAR